MRISSRPEEKCFEISDYLNGDHRQEMIRDIRAGMTQAQKSIPSKYFYDEYGSCLFKQICSTLEYYPTRTELSILDRSAAEIMTFFSNDGGDLIELGSGSNRKIRKLLDAVRSYQLNKIRYVPVDISESSLLEASRELLDLYKNLQISGILADFTRHMDVIPHGRKLIIFFGGSIGNFREKERISFLRSIRHIMTPNDRFLLGMDMLKPIEVMEAAYNDKQGITGEFNRNILNNINRELNADFNPESFEHLAFFNPREERVEMHLRARHAVTVHISDLSLSIDFREGETIHTEICKKFSREREDRTFRKAGLSVTRSFSDLKGWFSLVELKTEEFPLYQVYG
jgi:L-histidine N-alpha-methyltransferase